MPGATWSCSSWPRPVHPELVTGAACAGFRRHVDILLMDAGADDPVLGAELILAPLAGDFLRHLAVERELERDAIRAGLLRLAPRLARS